MLKGSSHHAQVIHGGKMRQGDGKNRDGLELWLSQPQDECHVNTVLLPISVERGQGGGMHGKLFTKNDTEAYRKAHCTGQIPRRYV